MKVYIVEPSDTASEATRALFKQMLPGSVAVAAPSMGSLTVYYEGGKHIRGNPPREATPEERINYAKVAAGRAIQHASTIAKFSVHGSMNELKIVGWVETDWQVEWLAPVPAEEGPL